MLSKKIQVTESYKKILIVFLIVAVLLMLTIFYFSLSRTTIKIYPTKAKTSVDFITQLTGGESSSSAKIIQTEIEITQEFTSSETEIAAKKAGGEITIINNYSKSQSLIATTRFLSPKGILYRLDKGVDLSPGEEIKATIHADKEGDEYEAGPGQFTIPGLWTGLQDKIYGQADKKMTAGTEKVFMVTQEDIDDSTEIVVQTANKKGLEAINKKLVSDEKKLHLISSQKIISSKSNFTAGEQEEKFEVTVKILVTAVIFDDNKLFKLAKEKLQEKISDSREIVDYNQDSLDFLLEDYDFDKQIADIKIYMEGNATIKDNAKVLQVKNLIGRTELEVLDYFADYPEIERVEVDFSPFWVKAVPAIESHVKVILEK